MSDVNVAPPAAPGAAPPAAPSSSPGEVPVAPSPHTPTPVGQQAPAKPVTDLQGSQHRPQSRREVIQEAFRKAEEKGRPGPAQAKPGHNQPPEETSRERKAPPAQQAAPQRERGEGGRFVAQQGAAGSPSGSPQVRGQVRGGEPGQAPQQPQHPPLPETARFRQPPPRFDRRAQIDWHATPESVRANVARMHHEFGKAHQQYRADAETMNTIRPFHQLATSQGTTLARALNNYVNMEKKLREDVVSGLDIIVNNLNLRGQDGRKLSLRDIAYYVLTQSPEAHRQLQQGNQQQAQTHQIGQLHQMVNTLARGMQQMHAERQFVQTRSAVDQFADQHPRFDELGDLIEKELHLGFSLPEAYRRAELLRPPKAQAAQTRNPPAQTRTADRSISGAPDGGSSNEPTRRKGDKPVERRTAIQNAIRRVNGGL